MVRRSTTGPDADARGVRARVRGRRGIAKILEVTGRQLPLNANVYVRFSRLHCRSV